PHPGQSDRCHAQVLDSSCNDFSLPSVDLGESPYGSRPSSTPSFSEVCPESLVAAGFQRAEDQKSPEKGTLKTCRHAFADRLSQRNRTILRVGCEGSPRGSSGTVAITPTGGTSGFTAPP